MKVLLSTILLVCSACSILAETENRVILYEHPNFAGHTLALEGAGEFRDLNDKDLSSSKDWDNAISSLEFRGSYKVTLFRDKEFTGPSVTITSSQISIYNLNGEDWDNQATSVKWEPLEVPTTVPQAIFYDRPYYQGNSFVLNAGQSILRLRSKRRVRRSKHWDDQIRSVRLYGSSTKVVLYADERFKGQQLNISQSIPDLLTQRFSAIASSLVVTKD